MKRSAPRGQWLLLVAGLLVGCGSSEPAAPAKESPAAPRRDAAAVASRPTPPPPDAAVALAAPADATPVDAGSVAAARASVVQQLLAAPRREHAGTAGGRAYTISLPDVPFLAHRPLGGGEGWFFSGRDAAGTDEAFMLRVDPEPEPVPDKKMAVLTARGHTQGVELYFEQTRDGYAYGYRSDSGDELDAYRIIGVRGDGLRCAAKVHGAILGAPLADAAAWQRYLTALCASLRWAD